MVCYLSYTGCGWQTFDLKLEMLQLCHQCMRQEPQLYYLKVFALWIYEFIPSYRSCNLTLSDTESHFFFNITKSYVLHFVIIMSIVILKGSVATISVKFILNVALISVN